MELSFSTSFAPDAKKGGSKLPTYDLPPGCSLTNHQTKTKKSGNSSKKTTTHEIVCDE